MNQSISNAQGKTFAHVTYVVGDTRLGSERTKVAFEAQPLCLHIRRRHDDSSLLAIPWANIRDIEGTWVERSYIGKAIADVFRAIPLLDLTQASSKAEYGLTLIYWDDEIQREQTPTFAIGGDPRRYETLRYAIFLFRDQFVGSLGTNSRPERR